MDENADIAAFLSRYIDCEVVARRVITFYKRAEGKPLRSTLYLPNILKAVHYFNVACSDSLIYTLFPGGEGVRHAKSPRQLRNGYVHKKSPQDSKEMLANYDAWMQKMQKFLNSVMHHFAPQ